jgi:hypothetical protein
MTGPPPDQDAVIYSHAKARTNCPACGRYVGPLELCPYCRKFTRKRPIIFALKYLTPILSILGMFALKHMGDTMGNPLVKLGELGPTSNFAYVQLEGEVCGEPRFYHVPGSDDPLAGSMEFCLNDGTGQTRIKTYEDATRRILQARRIPGPGDTVRVVGNYQARTHKHSLIVGSPHGITITQSPIVDQLAAPKLAWAREDAFNENDRVVVTGYVSFVYNDREKGAYTAVLHLSGGKRKNARGKKRYLRIELPWSRLEIEGVIKRGAQSWPGMPAKSAKVKVTGTLKYVTRGKHPGWRLYPAWTSDIELLQSPAGDSGTGG